MRAGVACLFFATAETLPIQLGNLQVTPSQIEAIIHYLLVIVAFAGWSAAQCPLERAND